MFLLRVKMPVQIPHRFWRNHFHYPFIAFIFLLLTIELGGIDRRLADFFYAVEGGRWAWQDAWLTSTLIHKMGKQLSLVIALIILLALVQSYITQKLQRWRREFAYLLCAAGGGSALVGLIKTIAPVSCAWDFTRYGGTREYASVVTEFFHGAGADCFPAGHASGGYAWLAFYFLGVHLQSRWRWAGLAFAMCVGLVFGFSQQIRGAHFISHDVWTLSICWFFSLWLYKVMLVEPLKNVNK
jgi:membrane-associated PAP2 superfamily phosphatase